MLQCIKLLLFFCLSTNIYCTGARDLVASHLQHIKNTRPWNQNNKTPKKQNTLLTNSHNNICIECNLVTQVTLQIATVVTEMHFILNSWKLSNSYFKVMIDSYWVQLINRPLNLRIVNFKHEMRWISNNRRQRWQWPHACRHIRLDQLPG